MHNKLKIKRHRGMRSKQVIAIALLGSASILGGCSSYSNSFDCPYGKGAGCSSVSRVNTMIDNQQIDTGNGDGGSSSSVTKKKNIHIFYGPERLSKIVSVQEPLVD